MSNGKLREACERGRNSLAVKKLRELAKKTQKRLNKLDVLNYKEFVPSLTEEIFIDRE